MPLMLWPNRRKKLLALGSPGAGRSASIGTVKVEEVNKRADAAFDKLVELLVEPRKD
jgi:hypothetical protein